MTKNILKYVQLWLYWVEGCSHAKFDLGKSNVVQIYDATYSV